MADIKQELAQYQNAWENASEETDFEDLPDGTYQATVEEVRIERSKTSNRLQLAWVFNVLSPQKHNGRKIFHYRGLEDEKSVEWMKREVATCGLKGVQDITQLPDLLEKILYAKVEVRLKTKKTRKGEFQNCYINKRLDSSQSSGNGQTHNTDVNAGSSTEIGIDDSDIPF